MSSNTGLVNASTSYDPPRRKNWSKIKTILFFAASMIIFVSTALALAVVYNGRQHNKPENTERHLDLEKARRSLTTGRYPFLAAVLSVKPFVLLCSAVILNERYLLTSANCYTVLFPNLMVRTGSSFWGEGGELYEVEKFMVHEEYDSRNYENNVAVVKTKMNIAFDDATQPVKISEGVLEPETAVLVGWGSSHKHLLKIQLKKCRKGSCVSLFSFCDRSLAGAVISASKVLGLWSFGDIQKNSNMIVTEIVVYKKWLLNIIND